MKNPNKAGTVLLTLIALAIWAWNFTVISNSVGVVSGVSRKQDILVPEDTLAAWVAKAGRQVEPGVGPYNPFRLQVYRPAHVTPEKPEMPVSASPALNPPDWKVTGLLGSIAFITDHTGAEHMLRVSEKVHACTVTEINTQNVVLLCEGKKFILLIEQ
jgi:hypothetical protein